MMQVSKKHELMIDVSATSRSNIITNTTFFSMDVNTGKKVINFVQGERAVDLTDAVVMLGFEFVGANASKIVDSQDGSVVIEDAAGGVCSVVLPNHLYDYAGQVLVHVYIIYSDGNSLDCGVIVTEFEESWLARELEELAPFYVQRFEDLAFNIEARVDELKRLLDEVNTDIPGGVIFNMSMLEGSGVMQTQVVDVESQRIESFVKSVEMTSETSMWGFTMNYEPKHPAQVWGGLELSRYKKRNQDGMHYFDMNNWRPAALPVNTENKPTMFFDIRDHLNFDLINLEIKDYDVTPITTIEGFETYLISGSFDPFENSEQNGIVVNFEWALHGVIDYHNRDRIYTSGKSNGFPTGSIVIWTDDEIEHGFSLSGGYFETEHKEWTALVPKVYDVITVPSKIFEERERLSFELHYPLTIDASPWGGPVDLDFTLKAQFNGLRVGSRLYNELHASEPDYVGNHSIGVLLHVLENGILIEVQSDKNFPMSWWGLSFKWGQPRLEWLEALTIL